MLYKVSKDYKTLVKMLDKMDYVFCTDGNRFTCIGGIYRKESNELLFSYDSEEFIVLLEKYDEEFLEPINLFNVIDALEYGIESVEDRGCLRSLQEAWSYCIELDK